MTGTGMGEQSCFRPVAAEGRWATADPIVAGDAALAEVKAFLRIESDAEDAGLARLIASAIGHGEAFTGRTFLVRGIGEMLPGRREWQRLTATPVRAITGVAVVDAGGAATPLAADAFAIDVDASGDGWVRVTDPVGRVQASYQAGVAAEWSGLPEPLRQGVVRLAAHLFSHRDAADEGAPPAIVAALWRPWRRMRLL
jgi:uncharacterized phiE125 gp8 family phage protein